MKNSAKTSHVTLGLFTKIIGNNPQKFSCNLFLRNTKANNVKIALQINIKKTLKGAIISGCGYKCVAPVMNHAFPAQKDIFKTLGITATGSAIDVRVENIARMTSECNHLSWWNEYHKSVKRTK